MSVAKNIICCCCIEVARHEPLWFGIWMYSKPCRRIVRRARLVRTAGWFQSMVHGRNCWANSQLWRNDALKGWIYWCILLQAIQNPFVEIAIKRPYRNSHFIPAVCNVQKAFKSATKRIKSTAHLVVIPVLEYNHFGAVCVIHPQDLMLEFVVRPRPYVVVMDSIAGYLDPSKIAKVAVR